MRLPYDRAAFRQRIIDAVRISQVGPLWPKDLPSPVTVRRWARSDAHFAQQLKMAQSEGVATRRIRARERFELTYDKRDAFLAKVRAGVPVKKIVKTWAGPDREALAVWKRQDGWFARAFEEAKAMAPKRRRQLMAFDQDVADAVIVAVSKGMMLREIYRRKGMPSLRSVRAWKAQQPEFASGLKMAKRWGSAIRSRARRRTPEAARRALRHIEAGGSLHSAGKLDGVPGPKALYHWRNRDPAFAADLRWAEKMRTEMLVDQAIEAGACRDMAGMRAIGQRLGQLAGGARYKEG